MRCNSTFSWLRTPLLKFQLNWCFCRWNCRCRCCQCCRRSCRCCRCRCRRFRYRRCRDCCRRCRCCRCRWCCRRRRYRRRRDCRRCRYCLLKDATWRLKLRWTRALSGCGRILKFISSSTSELEKTFDSSEKSQETLFSNSFENFFLRNVTPANNKGRLYCISQLTERNVLCLIEIQSYELSQILVNGEPYIF